MEIEMVDGQWGWRSTVNGWQSMVDKITTVDGWWSMVDKIVMVEGDGADGWQWQCARNEDGTGNAKVMAIREASSSNTKRQPQQPWRQAPSICLMIIAGNCIMTLWQWCWQQVLLFSKRHFATAKLQQWQWCCGCACCMPRDYIPRFRNMKKTTNQAAKAPKSQCKQGNWK